MLLVRSELTTENEQLREEKQTALERVAELEREEETEKGGYCTVCVSIRETGSSCHVCGFFYCNRCTCIMEHNCPNCRTNDSLTHSVKFY